MPKKDELLELENGIQYEIIGKDDDIVKDIVDIDSQLDRIYKGDKPLTQEFISQQKSIIKNQMDSLKLYTSSKKVEMGMKILNSTMFYIDILDDPEVRERIKENTKTPEDLKFLVNAISGLLDKYITVMRLDSADESGAAAAVRIDIKTRDGSSLLAEFNL